MSERPGILSVCDLESLARLLKVQPKALAYIIYKVKDEDRYSQFEIPKKRGGTRQITAPDDRLKTIQSRLAKELLEVYPDRHCVHGFAKGKSIRSNARAHLHKKWIVNIDLKDFFPSIHFGRVCGVLRADPFNMGERISREIANLCCCNNSLPQGAPTSPILSNFVCWRLDNQLYKLAKSCRCTYTRYADDITISTSLKELPPEIGYIEEDHLILASRLVEIISDNSFSINEFKVRYADGRNRQEVTGIIVNSGSTNVRRNYVRQVRAMLHSCERYGLEAAAKEHFTKFRPDKKPSDLVRSFMYELEGKIGYIRYIKQVPKEDGTFYDIAGGVYEKLKKRFARIYPASHLSSTRLYLSEAEKPVILGEGKTDWMYIKKALEVFQAKGEFKDMDLIFREYDKKEGVGCGKLLDFCKNTIEPFPHVVICVFDRDVPRVLKDAAPDSGKNYKNWKNNIYSVILPHSEGIPESFCIEQYFSEKEIMTADEEGRRLYLSSEFNKETGLHITLPGVKYGNGSPSGPIGYIKADYTRILDDGVWNSDGENIALPKSKFAEYIYNTHPGFDTFSFERFKGLLEVLRDIIEES